MCGSISIENCYEPHMLHLSGTAVSSAMPIEAGLLVSLKFSLLSGMDHHQGLRESCPSWPHSPFHKVEAQLEIHPLGCPQSWIHTGNAVLRVLYIHTVTQSSTDLG